MEYAAAFVTCGLLCVIAQALVTFARHTPPAILNLFLALGGLLTPCGFMAWLTSAGQGGANVIISGAGNAFATAAALAALGDASMLIIVSLMFFITICLGIAFGEVRYRLERKALGKRTSAMRPKSKLVQ